MQLYDEEALPLNYLVGKVFVGNMLSVLAFLRSVVIRVVQHHLL